MCYLLMSISTLPAALIFSIVTLLLSSGADGQSLNATLVSSAKDLASALSNFHVDNIYINGEPCLQK